MPTLTIHLTQKMQEQLGKPGVWATAVHFIDGQAVWTPLVNNGTAVSGSVDVTLPSYYNGGKVYILVHSGTDTTATTDPIKSFVSSESDINIANAQQNDLRFDSIELTMGVSPSDAGNLTSVVGFGLPMEMKVNYTDGSPSQHAGYNLSGSEIFTHLQAIDPHDTGLVFYFEDGPLAGQPRYATSPASASQVTPQPFTAADWTPYLESLAKAEGTIGYLGGFFNGAADNLGLWHNQAFYHYAITAIKDHDGTQYFLLSPQANSQVKGYVRISLDDLANSIYATNGTAEVFLDDKATKPYEFFDPITGKSHTEMDLGVNNQWGKLFTELLTGLSAGFYGVAGTPINPLLQDPVDLDNNWNWDPTYAFGVDVTGKPTGWHSDPYSEFFFKHSNSYGSMYSDNLMEAYLQGGPLLALSGLSGIDLTLFADDETPTGYTTPEAYDYLAPTASNGLYDASGTAYSNVNLGLSLALVAGASGETSWMADPANTRITLEFITGYQPDATKPGTQVPIWSSVVIDGSLPNAGGSLWWNWSIQYDNTNSTFTATPSPNTQQTTGSLVLTGLPIPENGTAWTKITVSDTSGQDAKTFNLYSNTQNGAFTYDIAQQVIDGGAVVALPAAPAGSATVNTYAIDLLSGSSTYLDPSLLVPGGGPNAMPLLGVAAAPVVGMLATAKSAFAAVAGQDTLLGSTVHTAFDGTQHNLVAFGWTGTNLPATDLSSWLTNYTNKISALDTVYLDIARHTDSGLQHSHITTHADLDGQWSTPGYVFKPGVYTITMTSFAAADTKFAHALSQPSQAIELHVTSTGGGTQASRIEQADGTLALDTGVGETAGVAYRLYQAALERAPDAEGLGYWIATLESGQLSATGLAQALLTSAEFVLDDGALADMTDTQFINLAYQKLFDRSAETAGLDYWLGQLQDGASEAQVLLAIAESAEALETLAGGVEHGIWFV